MQDRSKTLSTRFYYAEIAVPEYSPLIYLGNSKKTRSKITCIGFINKTCSTYNALSIIIKRNSQIN